MTTEAKWRAPVKAWRAYQVEMEEREQMPTNHLEKNVERPVPGCRWRILAHQDQGERRIELENEGIIDEVVIDDWLHVEQTDERQWWMRLGDARVWINVEDGGTVRIDIERGCYGDVHGMTDPPGSRAKDQSG